MQSEPRHKSDRELLGFGMWLLSIPIYIVAGRYGRRIDRLAQPLNDGQETAQ